MSKCEVIKETNNSSKLALSYICGTSVWSLFFFFLTLTFKDNF